MEKYADCSTPQWLSPPDRARCDAQALRKTDDTIKADRAAIEKTLTPERRAALRKADAAFEAFAKADCEFEASQFAGGSLYSTQYSACMSYWNAERAKQYGQMRKDAEAASRR